ncbi:MAG TPA: S8 family serine peptidase, partial [Geothrix sp.]|nr:S8 family serine peptidase [Geothrix sp.]
MADLQGGEAQRFFADHSIGKLTPLHPSLIQLRRKTGWSDAQIAEHLRTLFPERARRLGRKVNAPEVSRTYLLEIEEGRTESLESIILALKADPNVEYAEPNHVVTASSLPNDPFLSSTGTWGQSYRDLWGHYAINAPTAWDTAKGDGIVVAVIDTGVDYNHPDIAANIWCNTKEIAGNGLDDDGNGYIDDIRGWDFVGDDVLHPSPSNDPVDHHGHGTHVAGTIAAVGNNNLGIIGVAYNAKIMPLRGLDRSGSGSDTTLAPAIIYAAKNGADVINASWGGEGTSQTIEEAIQFAYSAGVVFVAAAGNSGEDAWGFYPANSPEAITVSAAPPPASGIGFPGWTNYGTKVDVAAPGLDILSLRAAGSTLGPVVADAYMRLDGTSMAAPHVSGLVALLLSQLPGFPIEDLRQTLRASAYDSWVGGYAEAKGAGLVDARAALAFTGALQAHFTAPAGLTRITGPVTLSGIAQGAGFDHYVLEYGAGATPGIWNSLGTGAVATAGGVLGVFDPSLLPDGYYTIRLTVFDALGRVFMDRLGLEVAYLSISSPSRPAVPVTASVFKPGAQVPIQGTATGPSFRAYRLEWARGIDANSGWSQVGVNLVAGGATPVPSGPLGTWDTSGIMQADYYTIRLTVDNGSFESSATTLVYLEPDLLSQNWPQALNQGSSMFRGLVPMVEANGDTLLGLVAPTTLSFPTSQLLAFTPDGVLKNRLEFIGGGSYNNACAGDVTGTGTQDLVLTASNDALTRFKPDFSSLALPVKPTDQTLDYWTATPTLARLEGPEAPLDIVALGCDRSSGLAALYAWRGDGSMPFLHLPSAIPDQHTAIRYGQDGTPRVLVGDVNGDGFMEFVVVEGLSPTTYTLGLFALDGAPVPWSIPVFTGEPTALALADLDHNGKLETILIDSWSAVHIFQPDGSERAGWPQPLPTDFRESGLAIGDLAHNGSEQIIVATPRKLFVFNADGTAYPGAWPMTLVDQCSPYVTLADTDGDGAQEILVTQLGSGWQSNSYETSGSSASPGSLSSQESVQRAVCGDDVRLNRWVSTQDEGAAYGSTWYVAPYVAAYRLDGTVARRWNLLGAAGNQPSFRALLAVGDFNRDGLTDIAVTYSTMEGGGTSGWLMQGVATVLSTGAPFNASSSDWPMGNRDAQNASVLSRVQVIPPPPAITGFNPGVACTGSVVSISGAGLRFATAVAFNGKASNFTVISDTSITATVPVGATTGRVSVTTPGGIGSTSTSFTVIPAPTVTGLSPSSGPVGTLVTLTGTGFSDASAVTFNGTAATFTLVSDGSITATVPAGATTGRVSVTTPGGTGSTSTSFTVIPAPTVIALGPTTGPVGTLVTLTGAGFSGATAVTFNGTPASFTVISDVSITATVPAGATTGRVS